MSMCVCGHHMFSHDVRTKRCEICGCGCFRTKEMEEFVMKHTKEMGVFE